MMSPREILDRLEAMGIQPAGEAILQAGMHHLECQFDFHALVDQLERTAEVHTMAPFTTFPYLRQAFTEGERWPEHIHQAEIRGVPVVCINARLSDRSYRRMRRVKWAVAPLLSGVTRLLPCSTHDEERFREFAFPLVPARVA